MESRGGKAAVSSRPVHRFPLPSGEGSTHISHGRGRSPSPVGPSQSQGPGGVGGAWPERIQLPPQPQWSGVRLSGVGFRSEGSGGWLPARCLITAPEGMLIDRSHGKTFNKDRRRVLTHETRSRVATPVSEGKRTWGLAGRVQGENRNVAPLKFTPLTHQRVLLTQRKPQTSGSDLSHSLNTRPVP